MKTNALRFVTLAILLFSCDNDPTEKNASVLPENTIQYDVDLTASGPQYTMFKVSCHVAEGTLTEDIFQFPATIPGVYSVYNYGAYVTNLIAVNAQGISLPVDRLNSNQFRITDFEDIRRVDYQVLETINQPRPEPYPGDYTAYSSPLPMAGTSVTENHTLIQTSALLGFPSHPEDVSTIRVKIKLPPSWSISTSAPFTDGVYVFENYHDLYDAPILAGNTAYFTQSHFDVNQTRFEIAAYAPTQSITASQLKPSIEKTMEGAAAFLGELPIDHYNFLFALEAHAGALEHLHSSVYTLSEQAAANPNYVAALEHIVAHEFMHVITPLNIRSEIIHNFSYDVPTASQHLWFYEGVTEWAALLMRYRGGSLPLESEGNDDLLYELGKRNSYTYTHYFNLSLSDIGLNCFEDQGRRNFANVYYRGSMVAALLDIRLLQLSNGESGLRELMLDLLKQYDRNHPFQESEFFSTLVTKSYPEIEDFINRYVTGNEPLPIEEYFDLIGISCHVDPVTYWTTFEPRIDLTSQQEFLFLRWSQNLPL